MTTNANDNNTTTTTTETYIWRYAYDLIIDTIKEKEEMVRIPKCVMEVLAETVGIDRNAIDIDTKEGMIYAFEWLRDLLKVKKKEKTRYPPPESFYSFYKSEEATSILKLKYTPTELSTIALVVNPNPTKRWKIKPLLRAFRHLVEFEEKIKGIVLLSSSSRKRRDLTLSSSFFHAPKVERKKDENSIDAYDLIMVYSLLILLNRHSFLSLETTYETLVAILNFELSFSDYFSSSKTTTTTTTDEELIFKINTYLLHEYKYPSENFYRILNGESNCDDHDHRICRCLCGEEESPHKQIKEFIETELLPHCAKNLLQMKGGKKYGETYISPSSHVEAISFAAILYGIDVSSAKCPSLEFIKMLMSPTTPYTPFFGEKSHFGKWYKRSGKCFFNIGQRWVPYFSPLYTRGQLEFFAHQEGFIVEKVRDVVVYTLDESIASGFSSAATSTSLDSASPPVIITITPPPSPSGSASTGEIATTTTTTSSRRLVEKHGGSSHSSQKQRVAFFSPQEALSKAHGKETVFKGWHPQSKNTSSPISLEDLDDVLREHGESGIVSFSSSLNNNTKGSSGERIVVAYSIRDVCDLFISSRAYLICDEEGKTKYLSKKTVKKLREIYSVSSSSPTVPTSQGCFDSSPGGRGWDDNEEDEKERTNREFLKAAMRIVDMRDVELSEHANEILKLGQTNEKVKEQAAHSFYKLLELGMYMRGWKVASASASASAGGAAAVYPLSSVSTLIEPENQPLIDLNVTEALRSYEEAVSQIEDREMRRLVKSAPLLKVVYKSCPPHFASTVNMEQGFTIEDRINIIKEGTDGSIFSCMRMSSNFLVASSFYYLTASLFKDPGFDISQLEEIL